MPKKLISLFSTLTAIVLASFAYIKCVEKRSYRSFLYELLIRYTGVKAIMSRLIKKQDLLEQISQISKIPVPDVPYPFKSEMTMTYIENNKVFTLNDANEPTQPFIIYVHGGAWYEGPTPLHFNYVDTLASLFDAKVIMPIYPRLPDADYRRTFSMLDTLYREILAHVASTEQITIMGDSAGGQISLSFAQYLQTQSLSQPKHIVLLSPVLDASFSNPSAKHYEKRDPMLEIEGGKYLGKLWAGDLNINDYKVSPINGPLRHLGHITLCIGTRDLLYPDVEKLSNMLTTQGIAHNFIVHKHLFHDYQIFDIPEKADVLKKLRQIITIQ